MASALLLAAVVPLSASCDDRTSVFVTVSTDIADLDSVTLQATGPRGASVTASEVPRINGTFQREYLATEEMDGETFSFLAVGYRGNAQVASQKQQAAIVRGESQVLALYLCSQCGELACEKDGCDDDAGLCGLQGYPPEPTWPDEVPPPKCTPPAPPGCVDNVECAKAGVADCGVFAPDDVSTACTSPTLGCAAAVPGECLPLDGCISDEQWKGIGNALLNAVWIRKGAGKKNDNPNGSWDRPYGSIEDAMKEKKSATVFLLRSPTNDANEKSYALNIGKSGIEIQGKCPGDVRIRDLVTVAPGVVATVRGLAIEGMDIGAGANVTVSGVRVGGVAASLGNLHASAGAVVTVEGSHILGSLDADGAVSVTATRTRVEGLLEVSSTEAAPTTVSLDRVTLGRGLSAVAANVSTLDTLLLAQPGRWVADIQGGGGVKMEQTILDASAGGAPGVLRLGAVAGLVELVNTTVHASKARGLQATGVAELVITDSYLGGAGTVAVRLENSPTTVARVRVERVHAEPAAGEAAPADGFAVLGAATLDLSDTWTSGCDRAGLSVFGGEAGVTLGGNAFEHCTSGIVQVGGADFDVPDTNHCSKGAAGESCEPQQEDEASFPPPPAG